MIGTVLIVAVPWIAFGLSLATICLRLRRFRRPTGRSRNRASRSASDDDNGTQRTWAHQGHLRDTRPRHGQLVHRRRAPRPAEGTNRPAAVAHSPPSALRGAERG
jgi:hypothetical protein